MVEDDDTSVFLRKGAKRLDESDALRGRAFGVALFMVTLHQLHAAPQTPEARYSKPPGSGADPRFLGTVTRECPT